MLSLKIPDIRKLTTLLFTKDSFDSFMVHDVLLKTSFDITFSGEKNPDFFEEEKRPEVMKTPCILWGEIRPVIFELIKGKRLPLLFKIVLLTSPGSTEAIQKRSSFQGCPVSSLSLNLHYHDNGLYITTGVAYKGFSLDKTLEKYWDQMVEKFLTDKDIPYEEV